MHNEKCNIFSCIFSLVSPVQWRYILASMYISNNKFMKHMHSVIADLYMITPLYLVVAEKIEKQE